MPEPRRFIMPDLLAVQPVESIDDTVRSLVEMGAARTQIEMIPVGVFRRYRGVLLGYFPEAGEEVAPGDTIRLYLAERALADRLPLGFLAPMPEEGRPESIFDLEQGGMARRNEPVPDGAPGRGYDPEELARRQLDGGRQLLRLLDQALRRVERDIILRRHALVLSPSGLPYARTLLRLLGLSSLDAEGDTKSLFSARSLAGIADAVGHAGEIEAFLGFLLGAPVRLVPARPEDVEIPEPIRLRLGGPNSRLGRSSVPGATYRDASGPWEVHVGPMTREQAERQLADPQRLAAARRAAEALLPAASPCRFHFDVLPEQAGLRAGQRAGGILGRSTKLRPREGYARRPGSC